MGRPQFAQVITQVADENIRVIKIDDDRQVPPFDEIYNTVYASPNTLAQVLAMSVDVPEYNTGTGNANDKKYLRIESGDGEIVYMKAIVMMGEMLWYKFGSFGTYGDAPSFKPTSPEMQQQVASNLYFTEDNGLRFAFHNISANPIVPEFPIDHRRYSLIVRETQVK